jgi:hypothetical protein
MAGSGKQLSLGAFLEPTTLGEFSLYLQIKSRSTDSLTSSAAWAAAAVDRYLPAKGLSHTDRWDQGRSD